VAVPNIIEHKILVKEERNQYYRYGPAMSRLLSLVSQVDEMTILNTKIYTRHPLRYIPMYASRKGGGAITLGNKSWTSITYTENFFSTDNAYFGRAAYGDNLLVWLRLSSHEVVHLHHAHRFKSFLIYLIVFAYQYIRYGHDGAPLEKEANEGPRVLSNFIHSIRREFNKDLLQDCLATNLTEDQKIIMIEHWWGDFKKEL